MRQARLHLDRIGLKLTKLTKKQADYLGVPPEGSIQAGALSVLNYRSGDSEERR